MTGLGGAGNERTSFFAGSTTPSIGDPGAESDILPCDWPQDGEWLAAARGEGEDGTGRSSEPAGSGEKSDAAMRSSRVKMGGGGGAAEGAAAVDAPEAKRDVPRWVGIGDARSRKKGDCREARALAPPRREAAGEREEEAMAGAGRRGAAVKGLGFGVAALSRSVVRASGVAASWVFVAERGSCLLYWAARWLAGPPMWKVRVRPELTLTYSKGKLQLVKIPSKKKKVKKSRSYRIHAHVNFSVFSILEQKSRTRVARNFSIVFNFCTIQV